MIWMWWFYGAEGLSVASLFSYLLDHIAASCRHAYIFLMYISQVFDHVGVLRLELGGSRLHIIGNHSPPLLLPERCDRLEGFQDMKDVIANG
ncbi:hypothetical protein [Cohaesibacter celericrescens]|uniref:Uncharacterized protein n=1 Tax=Cohaesibacter celericrescens TaxID=2067669 RepID=A0A2N5XSB3_9HYPH|nr:hypothetical protein [Cohaesibacter celericrescens]PLW77402.1 hypothetical protein C0081_08665 [Cohaesibacter celericrescens]